MGIVQDSIHCYELLRQYKYRILIENGVEILFKFLPENYHHLCGYQHLTDMRDICDPSSAREFYQKMKHGLIEEEKIVNSSKYYLIKERLVSLQCISEILAGENKVIVNFDNSLLNTKIQAEYYLYKRDGASLSGGVTYFSLFIGYDDVRKRFYPNTYVVEHSNLYINNQEILNCTIERMPVNHKKVIIKSSSICAS